MSDKRAMMFVDAQNLIHAAEDHYGKPKEMDFVKLVGHFAEDYDMIRPYWFDSHHPDRRPVDFYNLLRMEGGYRVTSKPTRERGNSRREKGVDIQLATELIAQGFNDSYEVAILVSGDADYLRAIKYVQDQGKRVVGVQFNSNTAGDLKGSVDEHIDLSEHAEELRR